MAKVALFCRFKDPPFGVANSRSDPFDRTSSSGFLYYKSGQTFTTMRSVLSCIPLVCVKSKSKHLLGRCKSFQWMNERRRKFFFNFHYFTRHLASRRICPAWKKTVFLMSFSWVIFWQELAVGGLTLLWVFIFTAEPCCWSLLISKSVRCWSVRSFNPTGLNTFMTILFLGFTTQQRLYSQS